MFLHVRWFTHIQRNRSKCMYRRVTHSYLWHWPMVTMVINGYHGYWYGTFWPPAADTDAAKMCLGFWALKWSQWKLHNWFRQGQINSDEANISITKSYFIIHHMKTWVVADNFLVFFPHLPCIFFSKLHWSILMFSWEVYFSFAKYISFHSNNLYEYYAQNIDL